MIPALSTLAVNASATWVVAAATPSPSPTSGIPDDDQVTPTLIGFLVTFGIMAATTLLVVDMVRRVRRTNYRALAQERIAEEQRAAGGTAADDDQVERPGRS